MHLHSFANKKHVRQYVRKKFFFLPGIFPKIQGKIGKIGKIPIIFLAFFEKASLQKTIYFFGIYDILH